MAQEKREQRGKPGRRSRCGSESQMSLSDQETRTKATMKDIEELYSALQDLVPKPGKQERRTTRGKSGTDTDTTKDWGEDSDRSQGRYSNGRNINMNNNNNGMAGSMKSFEVILDRESKEKREHNREQLSDDRMFVSDTELEFESASEHRPQIQRCTSLPAYEDVESGNEMVDGKDDSTPKKSLFLLFRRRRTTKAQKKKRSSWRTFLASLSMKRKSTKKRKKKSNNKSSQDVVPKRDPEPANGSPRLRQSREKTTKKLSSSHDEGVQKTTQDVSAPTVAINGDTSPESAKSKDPEPPAQDNLSDLGTRSDEVNRKLSAWYKHVVKETTSLNTSALPARYARSCESILTDSEILRNRGSSDTESTAAMDVRTRVNMNKIRVRKSRAKRNRRKESARWRSLPNVKLVTYALQDMNNKKASREKSTENDDHKEKEPATEVSNHDENRQRLPIKYTTTVKSVEAKLSFGNSLEKPTKPPMNDFLMIHKENSSSWLSRQCSKTTVSCIRPLQLNLFYSESPSREAKFRREKSKFQFKGSKSSSNVTTTQGAQPVPSAFTIRQTSSQRRRKRRSFKRQPRLPQCQSPFYLPENNTTSSTNTSKFRFNFSSQDNSLEADESLALSKDSGIGSPDHEKKVFRVEAINTSERRRVPKLYWESEDSGCISMGKSHAASHADTAIQTEPVIIMTVTSKASSNRFMPPLRNDSDGQSEA